tara:strand:+ start:699 stop:968 length:270 start_codon:yes stop_codon:yes gene_type:complete
MIRPIINNNGTDALDLIDGRRNAMDLIDEVIDALKQLTPHGRDYLGQYDLLAADRDTHFDRLSSLHTLREELLDEALHIQQQEKTNDFN